MSELSPRRLHSLRNFKVFNEGFFNVWWIRLRQLLASVHVADWILTGSHVNQFAKPRSIQAEQSTSPAFRSLWFIRETHVNVCENTP